MKKQHLLLVMYIAYYLNIFSQTKEYEDSINYYVNSKMNEYEIPGMAVSLIFKNKVIWSNAYGYANIETKKPFTTQTLIKIASLSKTVLGLALSHASYNGIVDIDKDINEYLPFKVKNPYLKDSTIITLRHIATHTSSIIDNIPTYELGDYFGIDCPIKLGDYLKDYLTIGGKYYNEFNFINKKSGTYSDYSNIAASLAAYVIECTSGIPYNEYCKKHIFTPLKMYNTGFFLSEIDTNNHAIHYFEGLEPFKFPSNATYPDGGVRTSVEELSRFLICCTNDGILEDKQVFENKIIRDMLTPQFTKNDKPENINNIGKWNSGYFWALVLKDGKLKNINHDGADYGVCTEFKYDFENGLGIIMFMNIKDYNSKYDKYFTDIFKELFIRGKQLIDNY